MCSLRAQQPYGLVKKISPCDLNSKRKVPKEMTQTSEKQGTQVTFLDQTGSKSVEAIVSESITIQRILPNIITKMNLPTIGPDGQPMSYSLDHKEGGRRLHESETLVNANVSTGDHLIIYPEIVAG